MSPSPAEIGALGRTLSLLVAAGVVALFGRAGRPSELARAQPVEAVPRVLRAAGSERALTWPCSSSHRCYQRGPVCSLRRLRPRRASDSRPPVGYEGLVRAPLFPSPSV